MATTRAPQRRVLGHTSNSSPTPSSTTTTPRQQQRHHATPTIPSFPRKASVPNLSKPITARVDPSAFVGGTASGSSTPPHNVVRSPPSSTTVASARPRLAASTSNSSAPSTPQTTAFHRASPSYSASPSVIPVNGKRTPTTGGTRSPTLLSSSQIGRRSPSPTRPRSPDRTPRLANGGGGTVVTARIGEGIAKASQESFGATLRQGQSTLHDGGPLRPSPRTTFSSSSSTTTASSSPLTSPNLSSSIYSSPTPPPPLFNDYAPNAHGGAPTLISSNKHSRSASSIVSSSSTSGVRRISGGGSVYVGGVGSGDGLGLLPPLSVPTSPPLSSSSTSSFAGSRSLSPLPFTSSPTLSDRPSSSTLLHSPSFPAPHSHYSQTTTFKKPPPPVRPASVSSNPSTILTRHARSQSVSSAASSVHVSDDGSAVGVGKRGGVNFARVVDAGFGEELEDEEARRARRESDEMEKEARVERRILDLEIRNASLLAVNTHLEVLKLRQTKEIRDLRRKLRESRALMPISAQVLDEGLDSGSENDDSNDEDGEEPTWEALLKNDDKFAAVANLVEALVRRAKDAVAYEPNTAGRVLHQAELPQEAPDSGDVSEEEGDGSFRNL
ncbi:hypothetical protein T439DRAFT_321484 [Meredithblackwellia eburnea MCA 4105]